jgi:hypothetical protein
MKRMPSISWLGVRFQKPVRPPSHTHQFVKLIPTSVNKEQRMGSKKQRIPALVDY